MPVTVPTDKKPISAEVQSQIAVIKESKRDPLKIININKYVCNNSVNYLSISLLLILQILSYLS